MVKIGINGALGRMGSRILSLAHEQSNDFAIVQAFEIDTHPSLGQDIGALLGFGKDIGVKLESPRFYVDKKKKLTCDVLIDFSGPDGARWCNAAANDAQIKGLVIGSTGLEDLIMESLKATAMRLPVVVSSNMSVGVNLLLELLDVITRKLPKDFDIEITEAHHRHKKDAPSGTALMLAAVIAKAKNWDLKKVLKYRGEGKIKEDRPSDEIGMQVIRAGQIVGDHKVLFSGPAETIEITHRAQSRDTFARGALLAAGFTSSAKPGLYSMADVLKSK